MLVFGLELEAKKPPRELWLISRETNKFSGKLTKVQTKRKKDWKKGRLGDWLAKASKTGLPSARRNSASGWLSDLNYNISALLWVSRMLAYPTDFGLARLHNCMSQFLKTNLPVYLYVLHWLCFSVEHERLIGTEERFNMCN